MPDAPDTEAKVLKLLQNHAADRPQGFTETELQQRFQDLPLRELRAAVQALEAAGHAHRALMAAGNYRVALAGADLEGVPEPANILNFQATQMQVVDDFPERQAEQAWAEFEAHNRPRLRRQNRISFDLSENTVIVALSMFFIFILPMVLFAFCRKS